MKSLVQITFLTGAMGMAGCQPPEPRVPNSPNTEESTLPPGVTEPPMTAAQQKVAGEAKAALHESLIAKAMQEFQASHERYPKDHEEFMTAIIEANAIELPPVPPGKKYQYNPASHELELVGQ